MVKTKKINKYNTLSSVFRKTDDGYTYTQSMHND